MTTADMHTDIRRNRETRDFDCYVIIDGREEYIGSRESRSDAETVCREYRFHYFLDNHTPEAAVRELVY